LRTEKRISRETKLALLIYLVGLIAYAAPAGQRLRSHTNDNHYVHLAYGWLHGRLDLGGPPPHSNDWAEVQWIYLKDGTLLKGAYPSGSTTTFRTLKGKLVTITPDQVARTETKTYVSFPPFPGLVMLPLVAIFGMNTNDVIFNVAIAPIAPALLFLLLRRLRRRGDSERSESDDLWLTGILGVGSVYYFSSVRGEIWYTAHILSVIMVVLYTSFALDARRPFFAGLALVCGFLSRPEILFASPLFFWELVRVHLAPPESASAGESSAAAAGGEPEKPSWLRSALDAFHHRLDKGAVFKDLVRFGVPIAALGLTAAVLNVLRFGRPTEFGHTYLKVVQHEQIVRYGLFNLVYLGRNLACAFALFPSVVAGPPWIRVSWHGLAMWVTTPVLFYLLWPRVRGPLHRPLWITVACVAIPDLLYQNSGWVQFGYRFSLDYMVFLIVLLAIGARPLTRQFKALAIYGFAINLFGAITFYWAGQFYYNSYFPPNIN
jgi:hypothetical protein